MAWRRRAGLHLIHVNATPPARSSMLARNAVERPIYMRFIFRPSRFLLEFICRSAQILVARGGTASCNGFFEGRLMLDTIMIAIGLGFFVAAVLYTLACDRM